MTASQPAIAALGESASDTRPLVRPVTDEEVGFYHEHGWVLLRGLVSPEQCRAMLRHGRPVIEGVEQTGGESGAIAGIPKNLELAASSGKGKVTEVAQWVEWRGAVRDAHDPVFGAVALDRTMAQDMKRLLGRDKPLRIMHDIFTFKRAHKSSTPTPWHQESPHFPIDRNCLTVWIALDEIRPEMGPLQFYDGSHRCGMLGKIHPLIAGDLRDEYPELEALGVSPLHHLMPGDATVHHGLTVHGAGANVSPDPRWSYLIAYFPSDARYTGAPSHETDGFGLKVGYPIDHPSFTLVPE